MPPAVSFRGEGIADAASLLDGSFIVAISFRGEGIADAASVLDGSFIVAISFRGEGIADAASLLDGSFIVAVSFRGEGIAYCVPTARLLHAYCMPTACLLHAYCMPSWTSCPVIENHDSCTTFNAAALTPRFGHIANKHTHTHTLATPQNTRRQHRPTPQSTHLNPTGDKTCQVYIATRTIQHCTI